MVCVADAIKHTVVYLHYHVDEVYCLTENSQLETQNLLFLFLGFKRNNK